MQKFGQEHMQKNFSILLFFSEIGDMRGSQCTTSNTKIQFQPQYSHILTNHPILHTSLHNHNQFPIDNQVKLELTKDFNDSIGI